MANYKQLYAESQLLVNGLVEKMNNGNFNPSVVSGFVRETYKKLLVAKDLILCANRYKWENLPSNITSQQIEALLYQYGSLAMYINKSGNLMISPYAMIGKLNPLGRLSKIQPIDLSGKPQGIALDVISEDGGKPQSKNVAVLIYDYTTLAQNPSELSRQYLNMNTTINDQTNVFQQLSVNVMLSIKKAVALCDNEDQKRAVISQVETMLNPSNPIIAISKQGNKKGFADNVEMFNFSNNFDTQNYCQTINFYDKLRRQFNGIPSPDTFEKKERNITSELEDTNTHTNIILLDGYLQRFNALALAKKYLEIEGIENISVDIQESLKEKQPQQENEEGEEEVTNGE